jgi:signal transduction histidine kinase
MSIRNRLLASFLLVIALATGVTFAALIVQLRSQPELQRQTQLMTRAEDLAEFGRLVQPNETNQNNLRQRLSRFSTLRRARVLLTDASGTVITDTVARADWNMAGKTINLSRRPVDNDGAIGEFRDGGNRRFLFGAVVSKQEGTWLVLSQSAGERTLALGLLDELTGSIARAFLAALAIAIPLAVLIARSISRPIKRVADGVRAMTESRTSTPIKPEGPRELAQLATDFNVMAERVRTAQQTEREFVANVSHELRTPLTSIQGFAQAIRDGAARDTGHAAGIIVDESARLQRMVTDLLDSARIESGSAVIARERVDLNAIADACAQRMEPAAAAAGVALLRERGDGPAHISGDGDWLLQVLTNLVDNAIAHTARSGRVTIITQRDSARRQIELAVTDTGHGIAADDLPRIFDRFYRADPARGGSRGAGLGLAIAKQIVEAHGGTITAQSVQGIGTRFTVALPTADGGRQTAVGQRTTDDGRPTTVGA